ncbi:hypothetical protein [Actinoplanes sp. HUAS TT8]|uniref:hypothetical protein n=1 Tax=Actinoplanes sp. HUAS TT8 TaxID=3447453 RepID=UPI003F52436E
MSEHGIRAARPEPVPEQSPAVPPGGSRGRLAAVGVIAIVAVAAVIVAVYGRGGGAVPAAPVTTAAAALKTEAGAAAGPDDAVMTMLREQAAALIRGDEAGWMAPVDPAETDTVAYFRKRFQVLRALHVSQFAYARGTAPVAVGAGDTAFSDVIYAGVCFSRPSCPDIMPEDGIELGAPRIKETFSFRRADGRYLITSVFASPPENSREPMPWQSGDLVVADGKRVTVAAAPAVAGRAKEALEVAEKAAVVADRFAGLFHNPQQRYRVFLADDKQWKRWFNSPMARENAVVGLTVAINDVQSEIMIKMSGNATRAELADTIQHEMGHVVSVGNLNDTGKKLVPDVHEEWLTEGVAEYIGHYPGHAAQSSRRAAVHQLVASSARPRSIEVPSLDWDDPKKINAYYGYGHFAIDCLAATYGEPKTVAFVSAMAREGRSDDEAATSAFGKPFAEVDKTCLAWIGSHA